MTLFAYLDGLPLGPVLLFAAGWLAFLLTILAGFRRGRDPDYCEHCGAPWQRTPRGAEWHICTPASAPFATAVAFWAGGSGAIRRELLERFRASFGSISTITTARGS